jgi:hypothetical protein
MVWISGIGQHLLGTHVIERADELSQISLARSFHI